MTTILDRAKNLAKQSGVLKIHAMAMRSQHPLENVLQFRRNLKLASVCTKTLVSYERLLNTEELALSCVRRGLMGAFVECGVWQGGVAGLMARVAQEERKGRTTHLFDSFEGLPNPTAEDGSMGAGYEKRDIGDRLEPVNLYVADLNSVQRFLFERLGLSPERVLLHKGWFQNTLPKAKELIGDIALLRIDADWYDSVKTCLQELYPRVVAGGYVILDDYGGYPGCKKAWDEFAAENGILTKLNVLDRYGVWFQKPDLRV